MQTQLQTRDAGGDATFVEPAAGGLSSVRQQQHPEGDARRPGPAEETRSRLAAVVESSNDAILSKTLDGTITDWNSAAERMYGYSAAEVVGRSVALLVPPERRDELAGIMQRIRAGERVEHFETVRVTKAGRRICVSLTVSPIRDAHGRLLGASTIARDITNRVERRAARRAETKARLRDEIAQRKRAESLLAGEKRVLELIAAGRSIDPALEALCEVVEEHCPDVRCAIRVRADGEAAGPEETPSGAPGDPDGNARPNIIGSPAGLAGFPADTRWPVIGPDVAAGPSETTPHAPAPTLDVRAYRFEPIVGSKGEPLGTLGMHYARPRPASRFEAELGESAARLAGIAIEHEQAEERARQQLAQLAHVTRMATMGEMASGLAHELNQPLCAIVNFVEACLEMLESGAGATEPLREIMVDVARQAERAGKVIHRLREFVRRREPQRAAVDVNRLVREAVELTKAEIRRDEVRTQLELPKRLPPVLADEIQIEQVILNLVRNALQAMQGVEPAKRVLLIKVVRRTGHVEVSVRDSGCGIPEDVRDRVFEPFFSTKSNGMGMGLSISRSILEAHEGRLWVAPNRDRGTTFRFTLPIARRDE